VKEARHKGLHMYGPIQRAKYGILEKAKQDEKKSGVAKG
jgi:hypothetical protein